MARSVNTLAIVLALGVAALAQQSVTTGQDGTLDQCQVILGSQALGDGTFDRDTDFTAFIQDGSWSVPLSSILNSTGDVLYVVPAAKSESYQALTPSNQAQAGYCYDTTTLLPQYNPLAVAIPSDVNMSISNVVVSPLSTVLVFGTAYGLTEFTMDLAFGLDPSTDVSTYDYIQEYQANPNSEAAEFWKESSKVDNVVTIGATLLANTTDSYASFAVLMYQALGRKALNASSIIWNAHLLNNSEAALNLNDAIVVNGIITDAAAHVDNTKDYLLPSQMNQLSGDQYMAAATSAANLNQLIDAAANQTSFAKSAYYAQDNVVPMVMDLTEGTVTPQEYYETTTYDQLNSGITKVALPSSQSSGTTSSSQYGSSSTQAQQTSSSSGSSGMSGGAIAGTVVGVVVGVALIALVAALLIRRGSSSGTGSGSGPRGLWRRNGDGVAEA